MSNDFQVLKREILEAKVQSIIEAAVKKNGGYGSIHVVGSPVFKIIDKVKGTEKHFKILSINPYWSEMYKCRRVSYSCINIDDSYNTWHYKDDEIFCYEGAGEWVEKQLGL